MLETFELFPDSYSLKALRLDALLVQIPRDAKIRDTDTSMLTDNSGYRYRRIMNTERLYVQI